MNLYRSPGLKKNPFENVLHVEYFLINMQLLEEKSLPGRLIWTNDRMLYLESFDMSQPYIYIKFYFNNGRHF
jgi:hypothetical protein